MLKTDARFRPLLGSLLFLTLLSACDSDDDPEIFLPGVAEAELTEVADAAFGKDAIRNMTILVDSPNQGFRWQAARGIANTPNGTPMTVDSAFRVGGVAKMFTSVVILRLVDQGFFTLDTRLEDILDDADMPADFSLEELHQINGVRRGDDVTIRQLLGHTSGLRDYFFDTPTDSPASLSLVQRIVTDVLGQIPSGISRQQWSAETLLEYFFESGMSANARFAPGAEFHYANTNYLLLGIVIEKISQRSLAESYEEVIYGQAQMALAYLEWYEEGQVDPVNHFWEILNGDQTVNLDVIETEINTSSEWGGGGVVTNAAELNSFIRELFDGAFFQQASTLESTRSSDPTSAPGLRYGLGLEHHVYQLSGKTIDVFGHSGLWGAGVYYIPTTGTSIVYTMNQVELDENWLLEVLTALNEAQLFSGV